MGTTCTYKIPGMPVEKFFLEQGVLRWSDDAPHVYRVLDSALVNLKEFYAAIEMVHKATGIREVWAAVIKVTFIRQGRYRQGDGENFCYKDMDETMGPYQTNCPARILKLLTPTENENALAWRKQCWDKIDARRTRPKMKSGTCLLYGGDVYVLDRSLGARGWRVHTAEHGYEYRMKRSQVARAEVLCQA